MSCAEALDAGESESQRGPGEAAAQRGEASASRPPSRVAVQAWLQQSVPLKQRTSPSAWARRRSWIDAFDSAVLRKSAALALRLPHAEEGARLLVAVVGKNGGHHVDRAGAGGERLARLAVRLHAAVDVIGHGLCRIVVALRRGAAGRRRSPRRRKRAPSLGPNRRTRAASLFRSSFKPAPPSGVPQPSSDSRIVTPVALGGAASRRLGARGRAPSTHSPQRGSKPHSLRTCSATAASSFSALAAPLWGSAAAVERCDGREEAHAVGEEDLIGGEEFQAGSVNARPARGQGRRCRQHRGRA